MTYAHTGKQVLRDGQHYADAADERAAANIAASLERDDANPYVVFPMEGRTGAIIPIDPPPPSLLDLATVAALIASAVVWLAGTGVIIVTGNRMAAHFCWTLSVAMCAIIAASLLIRGWKARA